MKNVINSFKMLKYSNNLIINFILFLASTVLGFYLMLTTEKTGLSCFLLLLGSCIIANIFVNLTKYERIGSSPISHTLKRTIPTILMIISSVFTFTFLSIILYLRLDTGSVFYSIYTDSEFNSLFLDGLWIIITFIILYPVFSSNIIKGIILSYLFELVFVIAATVITFVKHIPTNEKVDPEHISIAPNMSHNIMLIIGIIALIVALIVAIKRKPFVSYSETIKKGKSIKKYVITFGALAVVALVVLVVLKIHNDKKTNIDGIYNYSHLIDEYGKFAKKCDLEPQYCPSDDYMDATIDIKEYYYNEDTFDAYFLFTIEISGEAIEEIYLTEDARSLIITSKEKEILYTESDGNITITKCAGPIEITTNKNYAMNMNAKISQTRENFAEVKLILNGTPGTGNISTDDALYLNCNETNIEFPEMETADTFKDDDNVYVSNTSLLHEDFMPATDIYIKMKDGKEKSIMKDGILADGVEKFQNNSITKYIFNNTIDVEDIEDIILADNGDAFKPDTSKTFSLTENSYMRKIIYYGETQKESYYYDDDPTEYIYYFKNASLTVEWLQEPAKQYTDYIDFGDAEYSNILITNISRSAKSNSDGKYVSETIYKESEEYEEGVFLFYGKSSNTVCANFFEDTDTEKYTNHSTTIEFKTYTYGELSDISIYCNYYHILKDNVDISKEYEFKDAIKTNDCGMVGRFFMTY